MKKKRRGPAEQGFAEKRLVKTLSLPFIFSNECKKKKKKGERERKICKAGKKGKENKDVHFRSSCPTNKKRRQRSWEKEKRVSPGVHNFRGGGEKRRTLWQDIGGGERGKGEFGRNLPLHVHVLRELKMWKKKV